MGEVLIPLAMVLIVFAALMVGFPAAFTLAGVSILAAGVGIVSGVFEWRVLEALPAQIFASGFQNTLLAAIPFFILMGHVLEKTGLAENLFFTLAHLFGQKAYALPMAVLSVGALLAASSGVMGATVMALGVSAYPSMIKRGFPAPFSAATICSTATLSQIIPPSTVLIVLTDTLQSAIISATALSDTYTLFDPVSLGDVFIACLGPGLLLVVVFAGYVMMTSGKMLGQTGADLGAMHTISAQASRLDCPQLWRNLLPPLVLIIGVLGSMLAGLASALQAAALGAILAYAIAFARRRVTTVDDLLSPAKDAAITTAVIFTLIIAATTFALVFRGFGGDVLIGTLFGALPSDPLYGLVMTLVVMFVLGFVLDTFEIVIVIMPLFGPYLIASGVNPIALAICCALVLQTSFLTPPFGFALFYMKSAAARTRQDAPYNAPSLQDQALWRAVAPFIVMQLAVLGCVLAGLRAMGWV